MVLCQKILDDLGCQGFTGGTWGATGAVARLDSVGPRGRAQTLPYFSNSRADLAFSEARVGLPDLHAPSASRISDAALVIRGA
jgi:hypothetical protein